MDNFQKVHGKDFVVFGGNVQIINALERMLLFAGSNVHAYSSGQKGLSAALTLHPDIIIFEDTADDISATEVISTLQENLTARDIPLIIIGDTKALEDYRMLSTHGIQQYVSRQDFDVMQVILLIEAIFLKSPNAGVEELFDFSESNTTVAKTNSEHLLKLLVVEDDPLLRNLLSIRLEKSKIQFHFCHSGLDAVKLMHEYKPTVVLLDLMLPGKNGMEVLAEIREQADIASTPVIIFSNKDDDAERAKASALGVTDFLVKATTDLSALITLIISKSKQIY